MVVECLVIGAAVGAGASVGTKVADRGTEIVQQVGRKAACKMSTKIANMKREVASRRKPTLEEVAEAMGVK